MVSSMPRTIGVRWGTNVTSTVFPETSPSTEAISGWWRCVPILYGSMFRAHREWCVNADGCMPAPDVPLFGVYYDIGRVDEPGPKQRGKPRMEPVG